MQNTFLTPWNFATTERHFHSPDGSQWLQYVEIGEMGQGGPLRGEYFWSDAHASVTKLPGTHGGPPVWDSVGHRVVFPYWINSALWGAKQQLAVLDTELRKLVLFQKSFSVLHLQEFDTLIIKGVDSPLHSPASVFFDVGTAAIKRVFEL